ncbi:hypothetical protein RI367_001483 [Sorochytrium milnesiophthora]
MSRTQSAMSSLAVSPKVTSPAITALSSSSQSQQQQQPQKPAVRKLSQPLSFAISSLAPAMAVIFTNPFDTANTYRGLVARILEQVYKGSVDCMVKTFQVEGIRGLQKGLTPAILREGSKNLFRLGMYDPVMRLMHDPAQGTPPAWKLVAAGSICGMMGAYACNPFELIKTRLQSSAPGKIAVGHQHNYTGVWMGLRTIVSNEGVAGLYRGSTMSVARSVVGSGANLGAYNVIKHYLMHDRHWSDGVTLDMIAGLSSGFASVICMNPIDVLRTRYYNQPYGSNGKGLIYSSGWACARQVVANEGYSALYKGFVSHFMRIGPHFCLTFVFLGIMRRQLLQWTSPQPSSSS